MELDGVITGVENFGLFVTGTELPAEGFIHISGLTDDYYRYDRPGHVIEGHRSGNAYRLGDTVRVAVAAVDVDARESRLPAGRPRERRQAGERPHAGSNRAARSSRSSAAARKRAATSKGPARANRAEAKQRKARPGVTTKRRR